MAKNKDEFVSEWNPMSSLRPASNDISGYAYSKEYINSHRLSDFKFPHASNGITGQVNYFEPLEVKIIDDELYYRVNEAHFNMTMPDYFETQFGVFNNHNHGEFMSWLGKHDYSGLPEKDAEMHRLFEQDDFFIEGNYCDMFDCGNYSYAISNLMHMAVGWFKIVRIDNRLDTLELFNNRHFKGWTCLEYAGRFKNDLGHIIIASGFSETEQGTDGKRVFQDKTILFQIETNGTCNISKEWGFSLSHANSMVYKDGSIYIGQNKMVTRLNVLTGERIFLTNKTDEELAALAPMHY